MRGLNAPCALLPARIPSEGVLDPLCTGQRVFTFTCLQVLHPCTCPCPAGQTGWYAHFYGGAPKYHEIWLSQVRRAIVCIDCIRPDVTRAPATLLTVAGCWSALVKARWFAPPVCATRSKQLAVTAFSLPFMLLPGTQVPVGTSLVWSSRYPAGTQVGAGGAGQLGKADTSGMRSLLLMQATLLLAPRP